MSLNNPIKTITKGGLQSPDIGQTILGNIPSIPLISPRNYFLQQMESWVSSPSHTTQWIALFDDFPKLLKTEVLQELEYVVGDKRGWNIPRKQLTNYFLQKTIGCVFAQGFSIPRQRTDYEFRTSQRGFEASPVSMTRAKYQALKMDFLETNLSFVDSIIRPWIVLTGHKGLVARPKDESIKTNMTIIQYARTSQYLSPIPRKIWTFYDVAPVSINESSYNYSDEAVEKRTGIEFVYNHFNVYNTTYIPVFDLVDKFSSGGIKELSDTVAIGNSLEKLKQAGKLL